MGKNIRSRTSAFLIVILLTLSIIPKVICLPNFVIFLADNLGYEDVGAFSSSQSTRTPNIDKLAKEGIKLNNWNSAAALCSPSRSALLTGRYPVRSGIYPGVFKPDAENGLGPGERTIAEYLKEKNYSTSIIGKWHLGHREEFLPTNRGFDEWYGIPYHMSGGSLDNHLCGFDQNATIWLPLFEGTRIIQQPVNLDDLAQRYAEKAKQFIRKSTANDNQQPFFLYVPFSHVHQLCAPQQRSCQWASKQFSNQSPNATFADAVEEMDWIAGEILDELDAVHVANNTLVIFTSDNGPWLAEQSCSGSKGPFDGRWFREHTAVDCTACPHDYSPSPTKERPRRCVFVEKEHEYQIDGVHCGEDVGLGSFWEANVRMPAIARWTGKIPERRETMDMVSTLDLLPTILGMVGMQLPSGRNRNLDGIDIANILYQGTSPETEEDERILYFWRDGFKEGPLPQPYGRFDVVAVKIGRIKAWFYTKSSHYNDDDEVYHDPPLLFDVIQDPAEALPLDPRDHREIIQKILFLVEEHRATVKWGEPRTLARDPKFLPCSNPEMHCRSKFETWFGIEQ